MIKKTKKKTEKRMQNYQKLEKKKTNVKLSKTRKKHTHTNKFQVSYH